MDNGLEKIQHALVEFDRVAAGLAIMERNYKGVVYDVETPEGMAFAKQARKNVRDPRIAIEQNAAKEVMPIDSRPDSSTPATPPAVSPDAAGDGGSRPTLAESLAWLRDYPKGYRGAEVNVVLLDHVASLEAELERARQDVRYMEEVAAETHAHLLTVANHLVTVPPKEQT